MTTPTLSTTRMIRACRRQTVDHTPVWFMRQAGRYMPEYRAIREKHSMLDLCATPDLAAEVTLQPVEHLDIDAAILFSDILLPLVPMGLELEYVKGDGPVIYNPVTSPADVERLRPVDVDESLGYIANAAGLVANELGERIPLIGFAGAPFTLASYAIEGGSSRHHLLTKRFMYEQPDAWHTLMGKFATVVGELLVAQIEAGASVVQLFDSWVGHLSPGDYREFALPHSKAVFEHVVARHDVPRIHFGVGTGGMLDLIRDAGADVVGVDWRMGLDDAWELVGRETAVQGNLDPVTLFAPKTELRKRVEDILRKAEGSSGHVFNLGHGRLPGTPVDNVKYVVEVVREWRDQGGKT